MNTYTKIVLALIVIVLAAFLLMRGKAPVAQAPSQTVATSTVGLPEVYEKAGGNFSIHYPTGYSVNEEYTFRELGPERDIAGVQFVVPQMTGTNLSAAYVSVEQVPQAEVCTAGLFIDGGRGPVAMTEGTTEYSVASSTGAGAGHRYEETVYALPGTSPCMAVRYFIHSTVLENYPEGTVQEYDKAALLLQFDAVRRSLIVVK